MNLANESETSHTAYEVPATVIAPMIQNIVPASIPKNIFMIKKIKAARKMPAELSQPVTARTEPFSPFSGNC